MRAFFAALCVIPLLAGCQKEERQETQPSVIADVKTAVIRSGDVDHLVSATGELSVLKEVQLRSPVNGFVLRVSYFPGDAVKQGDVVAVVRSREAHAAVQGAQELYRSAAPGAEKDDARRAVEKAESAAGTLTLSAPFDGVIGSRLRNPGEVIAEGDPIASELDLRTAVFLAHVPSSSIAHVRTGQRAIIHLSASGGSAVGGSVVRIDPQMSPADQTVSVQITPDNVAGRWERGQFGTADIVTSSTHNALLVPPAAVLHNDEANSDAVMLIGADSVAYKVAVTVGAKRDSLIQVTSSLLAPGSAVIIEGHYGLPDSTRVRTAL